jgi:UDP-N-acetylmuramoylalanine--D-glutamate ligase
MEAAPTKHTYKKGYFKGKRVTVMGLGLLGRAIGDIIFLAKDGADIIVTDLKSENELQESLSMLKKIPECSGVKFVLGEHRLEDFRNRDFILKAAGVPIDSPYIAEARKHGVAIEMSTSLFASLTNAMIIGVTGTRGKTTTSYVLYEILKHYYAPEKQKNNFIIENSNNKNKEKNQSKKKVFLGGNIRGVSTLSFLEEITDNDIIVLELDSWQLQGFGERKISPHISVFTNLLPDHLNYYKNDMGVYLADKAKIFLYQHTGDTLILGNQVAGLVQEKYGKELKAETVVISEKDFPANWKLRIPGEHNKYNAALAIAAARKLFVPEDSIKKSVENFNGVSGRLEFVKEIDGVKIYNDTTSTTPDATLAALRAFGPYKSIVLIFGGAEKNLDMKHLFFDFHNYVKAIITLPGTGTERVLPELIDTCQQNAITLVHTQSLKDAVEQAKGLCLKNNILLFSPGFASFGLFKNEYDRGDQFMTLISEL